MPDDKRNLDHLIFKGLLATHTMGPVQAMIFMYVYNDFPACFIPHNGYYFKPRENAIIKIMRIKPPVYYLLVNLLVQDGWLERRKAKRGLEYRIVFSKLDPLLEATNGIV